MHNPKQINGRAMADHGSKTFLAKRIREFWARHANKPHTHPFCIQVHHSFQSVLHVMNFIPVREPKKYKNQLHVMIPTLVSRLALCCTVLHVMIHVLMLIPVRD